MADFDQFATVEEENKPTEEDPAAAFLAREQDELAGLEDDNFGVDNSAQGVQDVLDPLAEPATGQDVWSGAGGPENTDMTGDNDLLAGSGDAMGGSGGGLLDMGDNLAGPATTDVFGDDMVIGAPSSEQGGGLFDAGSSSPTTVTTNGPSDSYSAVAFQDKERAVPEKILKWREEQLLRLEKKDAEEEEKKLEWADAARKELDDWYKHHTEQLEKTKDNNRAAEEVFVKERDQMEPGGEWEKICRLCEFNPKNSKNTRDVSRMRSILLQLKQTPLVR